MTTDEAHSDGHEAPADRIVPGEDLTRKDYEKAKRSLQSELLEMQRLRRQRLRGRGAAGPAVPAALKTRPRGEPP